MPVETVGGLIAAGRKRLQLAGIAGAALDARLLFQHASGLRHDAIISESEQEITPKVAQGFRALIARREGHEPVSRIIGEREFHGRSFVVAPSVLDPRPDTETLIEEALAQLGQSPRILDLGVGSGAIIVTLLAERADATGVGVDVSTKALAVAETNARLHGVGQRLQLVHGSWFDGVEGVFDAIVSNPPYIPAGDIAGLSPDVRDFDPALALDGGADGLSAYRRIAAGVRAHVAAGGKIMVEIGAGQAGDVTALFTVAGFSLLNRRSDLGGHARVLSFC